MAGRIFDDRGNRMSPSHARKGGIKYRYYLSSALLQGTAERAGSVRRVPAAEIEALVIRSVREHLKPSQPIDDRRLINTHVARVEVQPEQLVIQLAEPGSIAGRRDPTPPFRSLGRRHCQGGAAKFLPDGMSPQQARPIRSETRARWSQRLPGDAVGSMNSSPINGNCGQHRQAGKVQHPKSQYDDLARFPCPRSRQSGHRRAAPLAWESPASATCRPNGPGSTRCSAFLRSRGHVRKRVRMSRRKPGLIEERPFGV